MDFFLYIWIKSSTIPCISAQPEDIELVCKKHRTRYLEKGHSQNSMEIPRSVLFEIITEKNTYSKHGLTVSSFFDWLMTYLILNFQP